MDKTTFILYGEYEEQFNMLNNEEKGELITAIFAYINRGEIVELSNAAVKMAFSFIRNNLDRDGAKYEEKCAKNKENGKKGGRPTKQTEPTEKEESKEEKPNGFFENRTVISKTERLPQKPNGFFENPNENENDIDNDNDNDIYTPPYPPKGERGKAKPPLEKKEDYLLTALNDAPLNHDVKEQMRKWLAYKKERKDKKYTQVGFNSLLNQTKKYCDKYGDTAVIECIENSISAGYQGIIWDKIAKGRSAPKKDNSPHEKFETTKRNLNQYVE